MAIAITEAPVKTQITARRATCVGTQYTVADSLGTHTVTVKNGCIGCACGMDRYHITCSHITLVEKQIATYCEEDARRAAYEALFDLSYGD